MKKFAVAVMFIAAFAVLADAGSIKFFFSTSSNTTTAYNGGAYGNPVVAPGTALYLYAVTQGQWQSMGGNDVDGNPVTYSGWMGENWLGAHLDLSFTGAGAFAHQGTDPNDLYNPANPGGVKRWYVSPTDPNSRSDFFWDSTTAPGLPGVFGLAGFQGSRGLGVQDNQDAQTSGGAYGPIKSADEIMVPGQPGGQPVPPSPDPLPGVQVSRIAKQIFNGNGGDAVYLKIGTKGIAKAGGTAGDPNDMVYFGTTDAGSLDNNFGFVSAVADATLTPEPASLVLLALAGLALRRR